MALGRAAKRVDPMIDVALARSLADSAIGDGAVHIADPARLMEILCEIADAGRIMPSLMRLLRHPNANLRSKAVKMIGRGSRSAKWVMGRLSESDPRIRANAVESLWGVDTPEARTLLNFAASDANNRVVGNALLGLYYLGEASVLAEVINLAGARIGALPGHGRLGDGRDRRSAIHRCAAAPDLRTRSCRSANAPLRPGADQGRQRAAPVGAEMACGRPHAVRREPQRHAARDARRGRRRYARPAEGRTRCSSC